MAGGEHFGRAALPSHFVDDRVHERGIGAAKREDRLLAIADPDRATRQLVQFQEERELNWTRVLKLVDDQQLQARAQLFGDLGTIEELERTLFHVDIVDVTSLFFPSGVTSQSFGDRVVDESNIVVD